MVRARVVLDASVGGKWIRAESGSPEARDLLLAHGRGELDITVSSHFCYEYLSVARREGGSAGATEAWRYFRDAEITVVELDDALVAAAVEASATLGCSFYDAVAPALARLLDAPLYSADRRAHGRVPGVVLLG
jgi:predicted nucleic acid-binding protein